MLAVGAGGCSLDILLSLSLSVADGSIQSEIHLEEP